MADSIHEDVLTLAGTRLAGLSLGTFPDDLQNRIEPRELIDAGWATAIATYPLLVVSGVGTWSDLGTPQSCTDDDEIPLVIRIVDRVQEWSTERRTLQQKWHWTILRAFRRKPLTLTISGMRCTDIVLLTGPTIEAEPLAFDLVSRPLLFGVRVRSTRP